MTTSAMSHTPGILDLFARPDEPPFVSCPVKQLEVRYERWYRRNPHVFRALERAAMERVERGATHLSVAKLFEILRDDPTIDPKGEGYKMDNSKRSYVSRHLMHLHPEWDGFFKTRPLTNHLKKERAVA